jgi:trehalose 6-phosphate phosphatase
MKSLFSKSGLKILESLAFTKTLYAFDFDGTLSKIVRVPSQAGMSARTLGLITRLSKVAPTAIISGRSIADLKPRVGFRPNYVIGNHGLEGLERLDAQRGKSLERAAEVCVKWRRELEKYRFATGVEIEEKSYSLALHYRRCRNKRDARLQILDALTALRPSPRIILGKAVVNLVPTGAPHKGVALMELMMHSGAKSAFYIGDDDTDEDVFALPDTRILTVRVGKKQSSRAQYYIERQADISRLLSLLVDFHEASTPTTGRTRADRELRV